MNCHAAENVLRRANHLKFVVDGGVSDVFVEQVANCNHHLPLRGGEPDERQRLGDANVEARAEFRPLPRRIREA